MEHRKLGHYRKTEILTADRGRLVVLLYEGALGFLQEAKLAAQTGDIPLKCDRINRAHDIIRELNYSLRMDEGGEIAQRLRNLYWFMERHLAKAKIHKDGTPILEEIMVMMNSLLEAWREILNNPEVKEMHVPTAQEGFTSSLGTTV